MNSDVIRSCAVSGKRTLADRCSSGRPLCLLALFVVAGAAAAGDAPDASTPDPQGSSLQDCHNSDWSDPNNPCVNASDGDDGDDGSGGEMPTANSACAGSCGTGDSDGPGSGSSGDGCDTCGEPVDSTSGGNPSGEDGPSPTAYVSRGNSFIDNQQLNYVHSARDILPAGPTAFVSVRLDRFFRSRDQTQLGSFGPGFFSNYDLKLYSYDESLPYNSFVVLFDPMLAHPMRLDYRDGKWRARRAQSGSPVVEIFRQKYDTSDPPAPVGDPYPATRVSDTTEPGEQTPSEFSDPIVSAVLTRQDGAKFFFEPLQKFAGDSTDYFRLTRLEDRTGRGSDIVYKSFTPAELSASPDRQWQIDTVTDESGRVLTFTYHADQMGGRWAVTTITASTGETVSYQYANEKLSGVSLPDGSQAAFTYDATSGVEMTFFDPAAARGHRRKTVLMAFSESVSKPDVTDEFIMNNASQLVRRVINGAGEISYLNFPTR